jgi:DNA-binding CsgD family transcriptional regulator
MGILSDYINFEFGESKIEAIRYTRMLVSTIGSLLLLILWLNTRTKPGADKSDLGLLWTVLALVVWIVVDLVYLDNSMVSEGSEFITDRGKKVLSTANNFFLLISLPYYVHAFPALRNKIEPKYVAFIVGLVGIVLAGTIYFFWSPERKDLLLGLDRTITVITYSLLCLAVVKGFHKRKYGFPVILLSVFIFFALVDTQSVLSEKTPLDFSYVLYLSSQIGFIMIIVLNASSWREEVIKNTSYDNDEISLLRTQNIELQNLVDSERERRLALLSDRERQVLQLIQMSDGEIASSLHIGVTTVQTHINILKKTLGVRERDDLHTFIDNQ